MDALCLAAVAGMLAFLQPPPQNQEARKGVVSGVVVNNLNGVPLRRARVSLRPRVAGLADITVETDDAGAFRISEVEPGQYGMAASRDGFLPASNPKRGAFRLGRVFEVQRGEDIKDIEFRMEPWAVIDGKVRYHDDTDPAIGVPVYLYRKRFARGRQQYVVAAQTRTDDRGFFRIHGLEPGSYTLAAIYDKPVDRVRREDKPLDAPAREPSYASVFYPSGHRITDALPLRLTGGQELNGLDMYLERAESIRVTGTIEDSCTGGLAAGANLEVARIDEQGATIAANAEILQRSGEFTIRGLTSGSYVVTATAAPVAGSPGCPARTDRTLLVVSSEPISNFRLMLLPDQTTRFEVRVDGQRPGRDTPALEFRLEPKTPGWRTISLSTGGGSSRRLAGSAMFAELIPNEDYDVFFEKLPTVDSYQEPPYQVRAGAPVQLGVSTKGAKVTGTVYNEKKVSLPGAVVTLIPESYRPQLYREGFVDANGIFVIRGLAPGRYIAVPWLDQPPCEILNPAEMRTCEAKGRLVTVKEGESVLLELDLTSF